MRLIVGLGAERPTVPQRSVPRPPVPLIMAATVATTTTAATAIASAQINIRIDARDERFGAAAHRDLPPPRFVLVAFANRRQRPQLASTTCLRAPFRVAL